MDLCVYVGVSISLLFYSKQFLKDKPSSTLNNQLPKISFKMNLHSFLNYSFTLSLLCPQNKTYHHNSYSRVSDWGSVTTTRKAIYLILFWHQSQQSRMLFSCSSLLANTATIFTAINQTFIPHSKLMSTIDLIWAALTNTPSIVLYSILYMCIHVLFLQLISMRKSLLRHLIRDWL